jgi:hypothetical protein
MEGRRWPDVFLDRPGGAGWSACLGDAGSGNGQQFGASQAGISRTAVRVEDPQVHRSAGRRVSISRDPGSGQLADHVPAQPDPGSPAQLELESGRLLDRRGNRARQTGRLDDDQLDLRPTGDGRQPVNSIAQLGSGGLPFRGPNGPDRQVQQQKIYGPVLKEHGRHRQRLFQRIRGQDHEPLQPDASGDCLHGIQAPGQIQVRGNPAGRLGLRDRLESQGGLAAGAVSLEGYSCGLGQPAQAEDRIQRPESRGDGSLVRGDGGPKGRSLRLLIDPRSDRQRTLDFAPDLAATDRSAPARSRPSKASTEGVESGLNLG